MQSSTPASALPALRDELKLYQGPDSARGEPTWSLHDPHRNRYFRIDWLTFEILCRWPLADAASVAASVTRDTVLDINESAVEAVVNFLYQHELVKAADAQSTQRFCDRMKQTKQSPLTWLLHSYLFFRLPLWRPDTWLEHHLPKVRWLGSNIFAVLSLCVLLLGLIEVSQQWHVFTSTLLDLFSLSGVLAYGVTLVCVKILHELGHAFTAKQAGCRVPTMGVAFLVMFPMAYTDVNDAWKLPGRRERLLIGAAGIRTELTIAAWATFLWGFMPDGPVRNGLFLLASTTWISTLLVNASPFLRFDGYFLIMDWLDLPNLHQRAFALARWSLRERLFGLGDKQPEYFPHHRQKALILFAYCTWLYRLIVFTGIAVVVYVMFPKPLGPLLAAVEIIWFLLRPVMQELKVWYERKGEIMKTKRSWQTLAVIGALALLMILPWDSRVYTQALLKPAQSKPVLAPGAARISEWVAQEGQTVEAGALLVRLEAPDLSSRLNTLQAQLQGIERRLAASWLTPEMHQQSAVLKAQSRKIHAEITGLQQQLSRYELHAEQAGVFTRHIPDLNQGSWVAENEILAEVIKPAYWQVIGYLAETERERVTAGDHARFFDESGQRSPVDLIVSRIDTDATRVLTDGLLASTRGGQILVREQRQQLYPEQAVYRLTLQPAPAANNSLPQAMRELRGQLVIYGERRAWGWQYWRAALALLRREAGF